MLKLRSEMEVTRPWPYARPVSCLRHSFEGQ